MISWRFDCNFPFLHPISSLLFIIIIVLCSRFRLSLFGLSSPTPPFLAYLTPALIPVYFSPRHDTPRPTFLHTIHVLIFASFGIMDGLSCMDFPLSRLGSTPFLYPLSSLQIRSLHTHHSHLPGSYTLHSHTLSRVGLRPALSIPPTTCMQHWIANCIISTFILID